VGEREIMPDLKCPKCKGYIITEKVSAEGDWIEIRKCANCGWAECPEKNRDLRIINRIVFNAQQRTMKHKYPRAY
jgi:Zn ribbon nucleic-acid-binding protein